MRYAAPRSRSVVIVRAYNLCVRVAWKRFGGGRTVRSSRARRARHTPACRLGIACIDRTHPETCPFRAIRGDNLLAFVAPFRLQQRRAKQLPPTSSRHRLATLVLGGKARKWKTCHLRICCRRTQAPTGWVQSYMYFNLSLASDATEAAREQFLYVDAAPRLPVVDHNALLL